MVVVPGLLMVSTIRFRSVKAIDVGWRRSYFALFLVAVGLALIASHPRLALVALAYTYTIAALIMWIYTRVRKRSEGPAPESDQVANVQDLSSTDSRL
jgi:phosphatidylserine synthase